MTYSPCMHSAALLSSVVSGAGRSVLPFWGENLGLSGGMTSQMVMDLELKHTRGQEGRCSDGVRPR